MTTPTYDPKITAVLLVDPYNDFLSEGGKLWPRAKPIAEEVGLLDNLRAIMRAARETGLGIFLVPHRRWEPLQYKGWKYATPINRRGTMAKSSRKIRGEAPFTTISNSNQAISSLRSIGVQVVSQIRIWTIC